MESVLADFAKRDQLLQGIHAKVTVIVHQKCVWIWSVRMDQLLQGIHVMITTIVPQEFVWKMFAWMGQSQMKAHVTMMLIAFLENVLQVKQQVLLHWSAALVGILTISTVPCRVMCATVVEQGMLVQVLAQSVLVEIVVQMDYVHKGKSWQEGVCALN